MASVKNKNTKPEILVKKALFKKGFRYRVNDKRFPGKPDIVLPKHKTVIFVNGCFWHGHHCKAGKLPSTRKDFWETKIGNTVKRDESNCRKLCRAGWKVIVIWQCELSNKVLRSERLQAVMEQLSH